MRKSIITFALAVIVSACFAQIEVKNKPIVNQQYDCFSFQVLFKLNTMHVTDTTYSTQNIRDPLRIINYVGVDKIDTTKFIYLSVSYGMVAGQFTEIRACSINRYNRYFIKY